jgi:hypothetical protein
VHPYGRYCNANKFAGEIDLFEAIEDIVSFNRGGYHFGRPVSTSGAVVM